MLHIGRVDERAQGGVFVSRAAWHSKRCNIADHWVDTAGIAHIAHAGDIERVHRGSAESYGQSACEFVEAQTNAGQILECAEI